MTSKAASQFKFLCHICFWNCFPNHIFLSKIFFLWFRKSQNNHAKTIKNINFRMDLQYTLKIECSLLRVLIDMQNWLTRNFYRNTSLNFKEGVTVVQFRILSQLSPKEGLRVRLDTCYSKFILRLEMPVFGLRTLNSNP